MGTPLFSAMGAGLPGEQSADSSQGQGCLQSQAPQGSSRYHVAQEMDAEPGGWSPPA